MDRIKQKQFTLRDMYEQFSTIMKMGPLGQVMVRRGLARLGPGLW